MAFFNDDQLSLFRTQSDKAFLEMQTSADAAMEKFLGSYSENTVTTSFRTPDMAWGVVPLVVAPTTTSTLRRKAKQVTAKGAEAVEKMTGRKLSELKASAQREAISHSHDVALDARAVLKNAGMDIGERAKREAAAMRDAARKAMMEERSLSGLADRARAELNAAKERIKGELIDAQSDALQELEGVAVDKVEELTEKGIKASEVAENSMLFGLDDLIAGTPPVRKPK